MIHQGGFNPGGDLQVAEMLMAGGSLNGYSILFRHIDSASFNQTYGASVPYTGSEWGVNTTAYVAGSRSRRYTASISTTQMNSAWYGWYLARSTGNQPILGYSFKFDTGQSFTKDSYHSMTFTLLDFTWGRS